MTKMTRKEKRETKKMEKRALLGAKVTSCAVAAFGAWMYAGTYVFAGVNFAENAGNWLLDQLFWIGLIVLAIALLGCFAKKNYTGAVITGIAGAVILYFVSNPQKLYTIGEQLGNILTNGS